MGNWTRVKIEGTCSSNDVPVLRELLHPGKNYENFHCLVNGGMAGLPNWASEKIDAVGNLAERGYSEEDVLEQLEILAKSAPSLSVTVHMGGDYEDEKCVASIVLKDGKAEIKDPEINVIPEMSPSVMNSNLMAQLMGQRF